MHAFDACRVGRYPTPNSPGKLAAYHHSLRMFRKAGRISTQSSRSSKFRSRARSSSAICRSRRASPSRRSSCTGRRRRLEGRPPEDRQDRDGRRPRLAHHRHAGQRREPGAVRRSFGRAHLSGVARLPAEPRRHRRQARRGVGRQLRRLLGRRDSPSPRRPHQGPVFHGGNVHYGFQREWLVPAFTTGGANLLVRRGKSV